MRLATDDAIGVRVYTQRGVFVITADDVRARRAVPEPAIRPTWNDLVAIEPRLGELAIEAKRNMSICWCCRWYGRAGVVGLKARLAELVGWGSEHEVDLMHTRAAYDVAYHAILELVPESRCRFHPGDDEDGVAYDEVA